jgi:hypothetical protein
MSKKSVAAMLGMLLLATMTWLWHDDHEFLPQAVEKAIQDVVQSSPSLNAAEKITASQGSRPGLGGLADAYRSEFGNKLSVRANEFLRASNYSGPALLAVWFLTGDEEAAQRLMVAASTDPEACLALASFSDGKVSKVEMLKIVRECLEKNPNNNSLKVLLAAFTAANGEINNCLAAMSQLQDVTKIDLGNETRERAFRELMTFSGMELQQAWRVSSASGGTLNDSLSQTIFEITNPMFSKMQEVDELQKIGLATQGVHLAKSLWNGKTTLDLTDLRWLNGI